MKLIPPNAAAYWSCLPIGSPSRSISIVQASAASTSFATNRPAWAWRPFSKATQNELEEPRPVPLGRSAIDAISSPPGMPRNRSTSRRIGCAIVPTSFVTSVDEYLRLKFSLSKNGWMIAKEYLAIVQERTAPP